MNTRIRIATIVLSVAVLAGCTTMSEGEFNNVQAVVGGSPAGKRTAIKECMEREGHLPLSTQRETAEMFNINLANYPATYCTRLWNAVASGRITYADYRKLSMSTADSSKVIRIMQGR
jgi:hypothetical protein